MPITITWSIDPAERAWRVASRARAGPMPVTKVPTHHSPAVPTCENTASPDVGFNPNDFTIALSSGCIGASTATRFVVAVTPSSCLIVG